MEEMYFVVSHLVVIIGLNAGVDDQETYTHVSLNPGRWSSHLILRA